ncbi:MAG TPA: alpha/beta-hydrolase family protein [Ornithinicoccus sp.]|nr:alpha/beta-hydrolase family protein [Ornithinicoccus sp.]
MTSEPETSPSTLTRGRGQLREKASRLRPTGRRAWWSRLGLSVPGCWVALLFACLSFVPSLIPRPPLFQGAITGVSAVIGYGLGVLGAWLWRELADRQPRPVSARQLRALAITAPVVLVVAVVLGVFWQRWAAPLVELEPQSPFTGLLVIPVAVVFFLPVIGIGRLLRALARKVADRLSRHMGPRPARILGVVAVLTAVALVFNGVIFDRLTTGVNAAFSLTNGGTPEGLSAPTSPLRSGSPDSLVDWDTLGFQGRGFAGQGPDAAEIAAVADQAGTPAPDTMDPIRTYAGLDSAPDLEARAALAVEDLERAGGFDRSHLLVVTTTGTGWVEPTSVSAFEHLTLGDSATVSLQYSFLPSALSFIADKENARNAGRALFDEVYERWVQLPTGERPKLYAFGESLGSYGAEAAFSGEHDMANRLSGAVFTGPPRFNHHFGQFLRDRAEGSTEIAPVYRDGRTVRFTQDPRRPAEPVDQPWEGTRVLYMVHPSDAITWWSTDLVLNRPDWLTEPRGSDVPDQTRWLPFVTFWQVSGDLALAMEPGPGYGHNFAGEHVDAWAQVLDLEDWTPERAERIRASVIADSREPFAPSS